MSRPSNDADAIREIIGTLLAAGYTLDRVADGGEEDVPVTTKAEAVDAITAVDDATLFVKHPERQSSHVYFVLGNDPGEVACDYGVSLCDVIDPLTESWWP